MTSIDGNVIDIVYLGLNKVRIPPQELVMEMVPRVRPGLMSHLLDGQLLVYDPQADAVHLLDKTTAFVFRKLSEEGWAREGIKTEMNERFATNDSEPLLVLALADIGSCGLLEEKGESQRISAMDRRKAVKKAASIGLAASVIPAIVTLMPTTEYARTA